MYNSNLCPTAITRFSTFEAGRRDFWENLGQIHKRIASQILTYIQYFVYICHQNKCVMRRSGRKPGARVTNSARLFTAG